jgi:hypothetical protein
MVAQLYQKASATSVMAEPGSPMWAQRMIFKLLAFFQPINPIAPNKIWYVNKVDLPPAADWPGALCVVVDQDCIAISRAGVWRRISLGGPV